jgi:hypothetical protein
MIIFIGETEHESFSEWKDRFPDGYVINCRTDQAEEINSSFSKVKVDCLITKDRQAVLTSEGYGVKISWQQQYVNNLRESQLVIVEYRRGRVGEKDREFTRSEFTFGLDHEFKPGWKSGYRFIGTEGLAQECVNRLMTLLKDRPERVCLSASEGQTASALRRGCCVSPGVPSSRHLRFQFSQTAP